MDGVRVKGGSMDGQIIAAIGMTAERLVALGSDMKEHWVLRLRDGKPVYEYQGCW